jgi:DNA-binding MarR family transcriptional regulator
VLPLENRPRQPFKVAAGSKAMMVDGRRLLRAGVIGLLLALLLGSGTGFALAQAKDAPKAAMARPMPGDHAVYSLDEFHIGQARGELEGASLELTWLPEKWIPDGGLDLRLVHPLVTRFLLGDLDLTFEADYDAATGEAVLSSGRGEYSGGAGPSPAWGDAIGLAGPSSQERFWYDHFGGRGGVCGMRNALQDGADPEQPLVVRGDCDYLDGDANLTYGFAGRRTVHGERTWVFREPDRPYLQLVAAEDKPFPLRVTAALSDMIYDGFLGHERMYTLDLERYDAGEGAYTWPSASLVQSGPGLPALVPRAPHLVDTSGYPFPFAFDDAYAAAVRDAGSDSLAPFVRAHPSAYVAEAYSQEWLDTNGATHYAWFFVATDGTAWTGRSVEDGPRQLAQDLWLPEASGRGPVVRTWIPDDGSGERDWPGHYLTPDRLPPLLPSAADLLARHRFVENRDIPGAHYLGWRLTCGTPACFQGDLWMGAGYEAERFTPSSVPVLTPSGHGVDVAILSVGLDGKPLARWAYTSDRPAFTVTGSQHTADGDFTLATSAVSSAALGPWVAPGPAAATGLGLLGLLASALYYFWPHLKGLALAPLFSRIADDEVLDNPNRARILDLVRAQPGVHFQDLVRQAAVGRGTLEHHLRKLEAAGLVTIKRSKGYACCFPKGAVDRRLMEAAPVLRSEGGRAVLRAVAKRPGASSRDLAGHLGFAPSTVSYHLKRLESAGLVSPDPAVGARLTPLGEQAKA